MITRGFPTMFSYVAAAEIVNPSCVCANIGSFSLGDGPCQASANALANRIDSVGKCGVSVPFLHISSCMSSKVQFAL